MSKRKLDEIEESDENDLKSSRQTSPEEKDLYRDSNGDHHHSILNINVGHDDPFPSSDFSKPDVDITEKSSSCHNSSGIEIPPAKRISKRCTKKADKLSRGKVLTLPTEAVGAELIEEEQNLKSKRRTWERWSKEDTYIFFEGLNEYGKDFDKLQAHFKSKYRSKKNFPESYIKNKDQIRHFYYRTWHKISPYINFNKDLKNNTKELSGLINYGELWKKIGGGTVDDKFGAKLDDMVQKGTATVKIKGKTHRIKTPVCRALKKLHNKEDQYLKPKNKSKLPSKVIIELRPRTTSDWCRVQKIAQNPHVRVILGAQRKLISLIKCLDKKWKSHDDRIRHHLSSGNQTESQDVDGTLVLLPPRGVALKDKFKSVKAGAEDKSKRPKIKIKLAGFDAETESVGRDKSVCDNAEENISKFEEILSMQRKKIECENENCIDDNSNDNAEDNNVSPKQDNDNAEEEEAEYLLEESDHDSRSPVPAEENLYATDDNKEDEGSETEVKDEEEEMKVEDVKEEEGETEEEPKVCEVFDPEVGWTVSTVGSMTVGEVYTMLTSDESSLAQIRLDYSWREEEVRTELPDMLSRLVRLAASVGRAGSGPRGRNTSTSSGGGSPGVRTLSSPSLPVKQPPWRAGGSSPAGAAKQIILPGGNGVEKPGSPLAVPLETSEHEFRKPLLPPAQVRQGAMSAAFKEQIGQYLPKWSNRPGRQRRSRAKQVVGRQLLQPNIQPRPPHSQVVQLVPQIVQVLPLSLDTHNMTLLPDQVSSSSKTNLILDSQTPGNQSPPQISIPSPARRTPSPTPSFSAFMDMSFDSVGQRTPNKSDQFLAVYNEGDNSLLQTPPRPAPSPSPIFSQDLSVSGWSLNFDSPIKSLSLPLPFNDDSQCSTISTSSEVSVQPHILSSILIFNTIPLFRWIDS